MEKIYQQSKRTFENGSLVYGNNAKIVVLIMYTGLRISEALGLKWSDVNFDKKYISINRNLSKVKDRTNSDNNYIYVETTLKRSSSKRTIPLSDRAIESLKYLKQNNVSTKDSDYVCMSSTGHIAGARNINRTLNAMLKQGQCEIEECGMHSLRHSFGSYLVSQGVDISVVSRLMGHKNIMITYNIYIHVLKQSQIDAVNLFNPKVTDINDNNE
jgi:integrase